MAEDFFGNLSKTLKKTVDTVGKKTDEFVEIQKIRTRQHALEDQIEKNYQDIGQIIYNRYLNGEAFDENLAGICKDITDLEKEIADSTKDINLENEKLRIQLKDITDYEKQRLTIIAEYKYKINEAKTEEAEAALKTQERLHGALRRTG